MFEDFENRMGFWKNLGSNFTIQYSGDAPSFMTDSEMWQSMDSGTTQTLAAWENGWVLTNNPDGTITANPKYTSGLPSETLTKVPIGFAPPTNTTPTDAGGGVVVAFNNEENLYQPQFEVPLQEREQAMKKEEIAQYGLFHGTAPRKKSKSPYTHMPTKGWGGT